MNKLLIVASLTISMSANGQTAHDYYNNGNEKANSREFKASILDYDNAIKSDPKYTDAYFNRGTSKMYIEDYEGAIADFDKAVDLKPDFTKAYTNRGIAKLKVEDIKGAIQDFDMALKIDPDNASSYFMRGQVKLQAGDTKGGCYDLSKANDLGDTRSQKFLRQYCQDISSSPKTSEAQNESLRLDWPDAEGWRIASNQADDDRKVIELLKSNETFDNWTEIGTVMVYPSSKNIPVDATMNIMFEQAKKTCPSAQLTFIEKDDHAKYPWIIFKIECSADAPESQVWQILEGSNETYINFRAIRQKKVPEDIKKKWVAFFKTASIVIH